MEQRSIIAELNDTYIRERQNRAAGNSDCQCSYNSARSLRRWFGRWLIAAGERIQGSSLLTPLSAAGGSR
ncbi:MAG: hypothetical protein ACJ789_16355 [Thermomicrobiales bacterium]